MILISTRAFWNFLQRNKLLHRIRTQWIFIYQNQLPTLLLLSVNTRVNKPVDNSNLWVLDKITQLDFRRMWFETMNSKDDSEKNCNWKKRLFKWISLNRKGIKRIHNTQFPKETPTHAFKCHQIWIDNEIVIEICTTINKFLNICWHVRNGLVWIDARSCVHKHPHSHFGIYSIYFWTPFIATYLNISKLMGLMTLLNFGQLPLQHQCHEIQDKIKTFQITSV